MRRPRIIAHRGNLEGPDPTPLSNRENRVETINKCLGLGFDVECDVWLKGDTFYLGHDRPITALLGEQEQDILGNRLIWKHAKNFEALAALIKAGQGPTFWHEEDQYTITSCGYIWTHYRSSHASLRYLHRLSHGSEGSDG